MQATGQGGEDARLMAHRKEKPFSDGVFQPAELRPEIFDNISS